MRRLNSSEGRPDRLLLYIDQWEELYAQASSVDKDQTARHTADVNRFIDLLLNASQSAPVSVVATVRADFYDPLISHYSIRALLPTQQVLLGAMSRAELESTIIEPAKMVGLSFDPPKLVSRILDEAGEDEGMLPLLQYALKETWELREGNAITADSYARSGGVREAIRLTAERTFDDLSPDDQDAARKLFLRLVTPGEGQEDTRTRAVMPDEPSLRRIVDQFAGPRTRLLVTGSDRAARPTVEVAHEALIRTWPRLRTWIDANRDKLRARAAVLQAKTDWDASGRRDDMLLPAGLQLERARILLTDAGDISIDDIKGFIELSSEREKAALKQIADKQRKQIRNRSYVLAGVSVLAVVAILLGLSSEHQRKQAEQQRTEAEKERKQANEILGGASNTLLTTMQGGTLTQAWGKILELFRTGAERGDDTSMALLGQLYLNGSGVPQDYIKAREWYEKAAEKGNSLAMNQLGLLNQNGQGVPQDYVKAREWYDKAAEKGNVEATSNIGFMYQSGWGVPQDYIKAREWYEKAAEKDNDFAQNQLGLLYQNGWGVPPDFVKARDWYEKAAENDNAFAMNQLGLLYANGLGVPQDYIKARNWYEKAAERDNDFALVQLGLLYQSGQGVPQDFVIARHWYEKAAEQDNDFALVQLGLLYQSGQGVPQDYIKAREWYEKAAENGSAVAMINLGLQYENGLGVPKDYVKAQDWYEKAAEKRNDFAMNQLGLLYANGLGAPQDLIKARAWFEKAAEMGNLLAMNNLGWLYTHGLGVPQDYVKAREWYEKAAEKDNDFAKNQLGLLYQNGWGVPPDFVKARGWYEKAAEKGNADSMNNIGLLYANGLGVPQDLIKARDWFEKAAERGNNSAKAKLDELLVQEAADAGHYAEALRRQQVLAEKEEETETKREGRPGKVTTSQLTGAAWYALLAQQFTKALAFSERAHAILPDDLAAETNRAHALMFLNRGKEAQQLYLAYKGKRLSEQDPRLWERVIADDFALLRKAGLVHPMMAQIEKGFDVSPTKSR